MFDSKVLKIRRADLRDAETLARIGSLAFDAAFTGHPQNSPDDMQIYMDEAFAVDTIKAELAEKDTIYFIAELQKEPVGYAKVKQFSREEGIRGNNPIELCRLYSMPDYIGQGIGKTLMLHCLKFAKKQKHDVFWLGVWEFNYNAQKFYAKFGFEKCGEHIFQLGNDPQTDWLLQRKI